MQMSPKWQQNGLKTATKWELRHCPEKQGDPERHPGVSMEIPVNPQGAHRNSRGSPEGGTRRDQELAKGSLHASTRNSWPRGSRKASNRDPPNRPKQRSRRSGSTFGTFAAGALQGVKMGSIGTPKRTENRCKRTSETAKEGRPRSGGSSQDWKGSPGLRENIVLRKPATVPGIEMERLGYVWSILGSMLESFWGIFGHFWGPFRSWGSILGSPGVLWGHLGIHIRFRCHF